MVIYLILNKVNGKSYVGATSRRVQIRWLEHHTYPNVLMREDVKKFGWSSFEFRVLARVPFCEAAFNEKFFQKKYNCLKPNGYNSICGWYCIQLPLPPLKKVKLTKEEIDIVERAEKAKENLWTDEEPDPLIQQKDDILKKYGLQMTSQISFCENESFVPEELKRGLTWAPTAKPENDPFLQKEERYQQRQKDKEKERRKKSMRYSRRRY